MKSISHTIPAVRHRFTVSQNANIMKKSLLRTKWMSIGCLWAVSAIVATAQTDPNDWQQAAPGVQHLITVADLPAPYETPSAGNFPTIVPQPANASLSAPAGFTV